MDTARRRGASVRSAVWTRRPGHVECCRVRDGHESGPPRSCDKTGCASCGRGNLRDVRSTEDMASSSTSPTVANTARVVECTAAAFAPLARTLAGVENAADSFRTRIPEGLLRTAQRWASMSPRQRASAMLELALREARRAGDACRAALARALSRSRVLDRTRSYLDALTTQASPGHLHRAASPPHGPPLALVLLDSTRPLHGPPLAA